MCKKVVSWWLDSGTQRLYFDQGTPRAHEFQKVPGKRTRASVYKFTLISTASFIPANCIPVTAFRMGDTAYVTGSGTVEVSGNNPSNLYWILENVQFPDNLSKEINQSGMDIKAVSDGSFKDKYGTLLGRLLLMKNAPLRVSA
jgi:hypothetical protein